MIKHEILRRWWEAEFSGRDRDGAPFLSRSYSTTVPAADFSLAIREFLVAGELAAVEELLFLLGDGSSIWKQQVDLMMPVFHAESYPANDGGRAKAEADAIAVLGLRSGFHSGRSEGYVIEEVARMSCGLWFAGSHRVATAMKDLPATSRSCLHQAVRSIPHHEILWDLTLRPEAHYGLRLFGNHAGWNVDCPRHAGLVVEPPEDRVLPAAVTKAVFMEWKGGRDWKKSWSRKRLEDEARSAGVVSAIRRKHAPEQVRFPDAATQKATVDLFVEMTMFWTAGGSAWFEDRLLRFCLPGVRRMMERP